MTRTPLGEVDLSSGALVIVDFGCLALFGAGREAIRASLERALADGTSEARIDGLAFVVVRGLARGRYPVSSTLIEAGDYAGLRREVVVELGEGEAARTVPVGTILVDTARVGLLDLACVPDWNEHEPIDGLADVAAWGGDQDAVAARFGLAKLPEGVYGVADRPYAEAVELGRALHALRQTGELRFAFDFRPHTHPYYLLAQIRDSETESGVVEVGGHRVCGLMTTWGDGWFPVELDLDAEGRPLRVRIVFATAEALADLDAVNP